MSPAEVLTYASFAILFYCYAGYGVFAWVITSVRGLFAVKQFPEQELPAITLVVAAYNEAATLPAKLANSLSLDYPAGLLQIIFVTDGSTDGSEKMPFQHAQVRVLHQPERKGKYAAVDRAMQVITSPIVVFSDCNALLNPQSLRLLVKQFADPRTGAVAGEKTVLPLPGSSVGQAEGLYWKYESFMKKLDSRLFTVVGAAGELFAIRASLYSPPPKPVILDDLFISMQVCLQGYRIAYEPGAFASETPSATLADEMKRKVRIAAGAFQALVMLPACLNLFKYPVMAFQYISRRVLRWAFCPLLLLVLFPASFYGGFFGGSSFCMLLLFTQVVCYAAAFTGWLLIKNNRKAGILTIPFYFVFMNYCMAKGFVRFITGKQSVLWERSAREVSA